MIIQLEKKSLEVRKFLKTDLNKNIDNLSNL